MLRRFPLLLPLILGVVACVPPEGPVREGDAAPRYEGSLVDGRPFALDEWRGQPVLVNIWATWCLPCRKETPALEALYRDWGPRGLRMVGVSVDEIGSRGEILEFLEEFEVSYAVVHDPAQDVVRSFGAPGLPSTYLVDANGVVRWMRLGPVRATDPTLWNALLTVVDP